MSTTPFKLLPVEGTSHWQLMFGEAFLFSFEDECLQGMSEDLLNHIAMLMGRSYYKGYFDGGMNDG